MARPVVIQILGDASSLRSALNNAEGDLSTFQSKMDSVGSKLRSVGAKLSLGVTAPLVLAGKAGSDAASSLEQSMGAVEQVFGEAAGAVLEFGRTASQSAGLSQRQVNEMAATIGASLTGMGFSVQDAADQVIELEQRAADMAATFGGSTEEAIQSMGSALRGERDPIERYGVSIKEADVQARILALGLDTSTLAAQKQATATATLDLILEQTAKTQGQFAREANTAAGAQARATAEAENARAELGNNLLPITERLYEMLGSLAQRFGRLTETQQKVIVAVGLLLAALGPLLTALGALATVIGAVSTALAFLAANPIVLVIGAIAAVAAGVYLAYQRFETFRGVVDGVGRFLRDTIFPTIARLGAVFAEDGVAGLLREAAAAIPKVIGKLGELGAEMGRALLDKLIEEFKKLPGRITDAIGGFGSTLADGGRKLGSWLNPFGDGEGMAGSFGGGAFGTPSGVRVTGRTVGGGSWQQLLNMAASTGLSGITASSVFRPGSITRSGNLSYHARGRAVDLVAPSLARLQIALQRFGPQLKELIGPISSLNWRNGQLHRYSAAVQRDHYDHVHMAYDRGGWLPPGVHTIGNFTGKPEPILTNQQWQDLSRRPTFHIENLSVNNGRSFAEEMALAEALYGQGS